MNKFSLVIMSAAMLQQGVAASEEDPALVSRDPVKLVRSAGPNADLLVREESIAGGIIRLTVVSKKMSREILSIESQPGIGSGLKHWEWKDLNGDDKPELLLWMEENFGKGAEKRLRVLELQQSDMAFGDVALIPYARSPGQTYPAQEEYVGTLEFDLKAKKISWKSTGGGKVTPTAIVWTWNVERQVFSPSK